MTEGVDHAFMSDDAVGDRQLVAGVVERIWHGGSFRCGASIYCPGRATRSILDRINTTKNGRRHMDFELPEELKLLKNTVRNFVDRELFPVEMLAMDGPNMRAD